MEMIEQSRNLYLTADDGRPAPLFTAVIDAVLRWRSASRQRRALAYLDDRLLNDIGLTRRAAAEEAGKPFWR